MPWSDPEAGTRTAAGMPAELGRFVELADWVSATQGSSPPAQLSRVRLLRLGAGGSPTVDHLAADLDVGVHTVGASPAAIADAIATGIELADHEADAGTQLLLLACPAATVAAAVAVAVLTGSEPVRVLARGAAATDPQAWMRRAEQVRDRRRGAAALRERPGELLAELGDPVLAVGAGLVLQAARRRTPVVLDGTASAAAALVAYAAGPRVVRWLAAASTTPDPAQTLVLTTMGLRCTLEFGVATGDGAAALAALGVLRAAVRLATGDGGGDAG